MSFVGLITFLAMAPPPPGTVQNPTGELIKFVGMFGIMIVVMYVALVRGPQKKAKEHAEMMKTIKAGDKIVTSGGILGVVVSVKEKSLSIRSADAKLEVLKSAVSEVLEKSPAGAES